MHIDPKYAQWSKIRTVIQNMHSDPKYAQRSKICTVIQNMHSDAQWFKICTELQNTHSDSKYAQWSKICTVIQNMHSNSKYAQWSKLCTVIQNYFANYFQTEARNKRVVLVLKFSCLELLKLKPSKNTINIKISLLDSIQLKLILYFLCINVKFSFLNPCIFWFHLIPLDSTWF